MLRSSKTGKSKSGKKRSLPPSKTQFAWAMEQRERAKTSFYVRAVEWETLGPSRAKMEAAEAAEFEAAQANAGVQPNSGTKAAPAAPLPTILRPTPTQRMVRAPNHLVFRNKPVSRTTKPK